MNATKCEDNKVELQIRSGEIYVLEYIEALTLAAALANAANETADVTIDCPHCAGSGRITAKPPYRYASDCENCGGWGFVSVEPSEIIG